MKFAITITASKLMAFCLLAGAISIDIKNGNATAFMFAIPFISALVLGKQYMDSKKPNNEV
jgi:hypothetical protein